MFSTEFSYTLDAAYREAARRHHAYFCVEHLLYALLFDEQVIEIIAECGGDVEELRYDLESFFEHHVEKLPPLGEGDNSERGEEQVGPAQTPAVQRVLHRAILQMQSAGKDLVTAKEVLVQIFSEPDTHAAFFLARQEIDRLAVLEQISHVGVPLTDYLRGDGVEQGNVEEEGKGDEEEGEREGEMQPRKRRTPQKALQQFAENLTERARKGELDPTIGRESELELMLEVLSRRNKNNPLLLGDPGVGKTAMANALAQRIVAGEVPAHLHDSELYVLHLGTLVAGTKFRGEFEERLRRIVKEVSDCERAILFIDEIHTLVGAGATGSSSMDAANLLKPALQSGHLRCIGSTTHEDFKKSIEKDRALSRRFSVVPLEEPSREESIKILEGLKQRFEEHHHVRYSSAALKSAVDLSVKHIQERFLPDKAIDLIDQAGAANALLPEGRKKKQITPREIERVVAAVARVPIRSVSRNDERVLQSLEKDLKEIVFGQEKAVEAVARAIKRSRASLKGANRPMGSFLFAGPTGVGKTELARALASVLAVPFHRFDMSEYMEKHAVARLIGAPPGYVGYEEGGILTDLVRKQPYAVLLLDEIEKAHQDIYNILLQVMDEAQLTDSHGRKSDFRNVIVVMTTNAGSGDGNTMGFGNLDSSSNREKAVKDLFRPEFRNRLDDTIYFRALSRQIIGRIVGKFIKELEQQVKERRVAISISKGASEWLAEKGFDPILGARPMERLIQREIKDRLADEILFGRLKKGGQVEVGVEGEGLSLVIKQR